MGTKGRKFESYYPDQGGDCVNTDLRPECIHKDFSVFDLFAPAVQYEASQAMLAKSFRLVNLSLEKASILYAPVAKLVVAESL